MVKTRNKRCIGCSYLFLSAIALHIIGSEGSGDDVFIEVASPLPGEVYHGLTPVFAMVDLRLGSGPISERVRANPSAFDLCVAWDVTLAERPGDDGDSVTCLGLSEQMVTAALPSLVPDAAFGPWPDRTFKTWLRDKGAVALESQHCALLSSGSGGGGGSGLSWGDQSSAPSLSHQGTLSLEAARAAPRASAPSLSASAASASAASSMTCVSPAVVWAGTLHATEVPYTLGRTTRTRLVPSGSGEAGAGGLRVARPEESEGSEGSEDAPSRVLSPVQRVEERVGVCLSGTLRTFGSRAVRNRLIDAMALFAETSSSSSSSASSSSSSSSSYRRAHLRVRREVDVVVELLAHVPVNLKAANARGGEEEGAWHEPSWAGRQWHDTGDGSGGSVISPLELSDAAARAALTDLNRSLTRRYPNGCGGHGGHGGGVEGEGGGGQGGGCVALAAVKWFDEQAHFRVPSRCALPPPSAYPQLYKLAACFHGLVKPREAALGKPFDWLLRLRWDLAWLRPPPPLHVLRRDAVSLPYAFWPISDQFAVMPRHLGRAYFTAVDSYYVCAHDERRGGESFDKEGAVRRTSAHTAYDHWFLPGQVGTELVLARHLLFAAQPVKVTFLEVNAPIARSQRPDQWCAIRETLQLPCLMLVALGWADWLPTDCSRPKGRLLPANTKQPPNSSLPISPWPSSPGRWTPAALLQAACEADFAGLTAELGLEDKGGEERVQPTAAAAAAAPLVLTGPLSASAGEWRVPRPAAGAGRSLAARLGEPGGPPPTERAVLEVRLARGAEGTPEGDHEMVLAFRPTYAALGSLLDATEAAARAWAAPSSSSSSSSSSWGDADAFAADTALAAALERVLRHATFSVHVPRPSTQA